MLNLSQHFADAPDPDGGLLAYRQVSDALGETPWYLRLLRDEGEVQRIDFPTFFWASASCMSHTLNRVSPLRRYSATCPALLTHCTKLLFASTIGFPRAATDRRC